MGRSVGRPRLQWMLVIGAMVLPGCATARDVVLAADAATTLPTLPAVTFPGTLPVSAGDEAAIPTTTTAPPPTAPPSPAGTAPTAFDPLLATPPTTVPTTPPPLSTTTTDPRSTSTTRRAHHDRTPPHHDDQAVDDHHASAHGQHDDDHHHRPRTSDGDHQPDHDDGGTDHGADERAHHGAAVDRPAGVDRSGDDTTAIVGPTGCARLDDALKTRPSPSPFRA